MKTVAQLLKAKDQKNQDVHTIQWDHTVFEALVRMSEKNVGALPVVKEGTVVGIISERDYARKIMLKGLSSVTTKVHEVMSSPVITVDTHKKCRSVHEHHDRQSPAPPAGGRRRQTAGPALHR